MNDRNSMKRQSVEGLQSAFSVGDVTATGERIFNPMRKRNKQDEKESESTINGLQQYTSLSAIKSLSESEIEFFRLDNRIEVLGDDIVGPITQFNNIGLHNVFIRKLCQKGITKPTAVQMQAIPIIMSGRDVVIHSATGTGKTLAYLLPLLRLLQQLPVSTPATGPLALIIAPTRELADQIHQEAANFTVSPLSPDFLSRRIDDDTLIPGIFTSDGRLCHRVLGVWGGDSLATQRDELQRGVDILVGTPGRLIDLYTKGYISYDHVRYLVLDEADKACDKEMENQIRFILNHLPDVGVQSILCSASFPVWVQRYINSCAVNPITVRVRASNEDGGGLSNTVVIDTVVTTATARFVCCVIYINMKDLLLRRLRTIPSPPVLIFVNSVAAIESLVLMLRQEQFHCCGIHSGYEQPLRKAIIRAFLGSHGIDILVCSSLLERGMDFQVEEVIIYEMPDSIEKFIHRAGRTGRAGKKGRATVYISKECPIIRQYKRLLKDANQVEVIPSELDSVNAR